MKLLNLGCGKRYHRSWINVDFNGDGKNVISHNLLSGIPFKENEIDVIYHSHVLEHFSQHDAFIFLTECFRVLKPGGIIRIAVPDLEQIVNEYKTQLDNVLQKKGTDADYNWILLELYDQTVRNVSGGDMKKYLLQPQIPNLEFIYKRLGQEAIDIRENAIPNTTIKQKIAIKKYFELKRWYNFMLKIILTREDYLCLERGKFRDSGEIHQWMYDKYSLPNLLNKTKFSSVEIKKATESNIPDWNQYNLDADTNGHAYKPDSLYIEAKK